MTAGPVGSARRRGASDHVLGRACLGGLLLALVTGCATGSPTAEAPSTAPATTSSAAPTTPAADPVTTVTTSPRATQPAPEPPRIGSCRVEPRWSQVTAYDELVDCEEEHRFEVAYVGSFDARLEASDILDADARYAESLPQCYDAVASYVGSVDWASAALWPYVRLPSSQEWLDGARWFTCDLAQRTDGNPAVVTGSFADVLAAGPGGLRLCLWVDDGDVTGATWGEIVRCEDPHHREAVGPVLDLSDAFVERPSEKDLIALAEAACSAYAAEFLESYRTDLSWWASWPNDAQWTDQGYRSIVCYVANETPWSGTLDGIGDGPIPTT